MEGSTVTETVKNQDFLIQVQTIISKNVCHSQVPNYAFIKVFNYVLTWPSDTIEVIYLIIT